MALKLDPQMSQHSRLSLARVHHWIDEAVVVLRSQAGRQRSQANDTGSISAIAGWVEYGHPPAGEK